MYFYVQNQEEERTSPVTCNEKLAESWLNQSSVGSTIEYAETDRDIPYPLIDDETGEHL